MNVIDKDARNMKFLKVKTLQEKGNPSQLQHTLQRKIKRLNQKVTAIGKHMEKVAMMQENGDMDYFDLVKYSHGETVEKANRKVDQASKKLSEVKKTNRGYHCVIAKGQQKKKSIDFRLNVKMY